MRICWGIAAVIWALTSVFRLALWIHAAASGAPSMEVTLANHEFMTASLWCMVSLLFLRQADE